MTAGSSANAHSAGAPRASAPAPRADRSAGVGQAGTLAGPAGQRSPGVVLDGTLGQSQQPAVTTNGQGQNDYAIAGTMGKQFGSSLFFSFSSFSLSPHESVTFSGPFTDRGTSVQSILARVAGGASLLDGLISTSRIPGATFYLLNPAGVVFGPNARLEVGGSFVVTTASTIIAADGSRFTVGRAAPDAGLSSAPVATFGFARGARAPVEFVGSSFSFPSGGKLLVQAAGDVLCEGAVLSAPSGRIDLRSHSGSIQLSEQALVTIDGAGGGSVLLQGRRVSIDSSAVSSANAGHSPGGGITVEAETLRLAHGELFTSTDGSATPGGRGGTMAIHLTGDLLMSDGAEISSTTTGAGRGGSVRVSARDITLAGESPESGVTLIGAVSEPAATGAAGSVVVSASGKVSFAGGARIQTYTQGVGDAGGVRVTAENLYAIGASSLRSASGIASNSLSPGLGGRAGEVTVEVSRALTLAGGGAISSSTAGQGDGGRIRVRAGEIIIFGSGNPGIFAQTTSRFRGGKGGELLVSSATGILIASGNVSTTSFGSGSAGNVTVNARNIDILGFGGISANSLSPYGAGAAGDLTVDASSEVSLVNGGQIASITSSLAKGGNVFVTAPAIAVTGAAASGTPSVIQAVSNAVGAGGAAGEIFVHAGRDLVLAGGGEISTSTLGQGAGGAIIVQAAGVAISGEAPHGGGPSSISADSNSPGAGGMAGEVLISLSHDLSLTDGGEISSVTDGAGRGGDISIEARNVTLAGSLSGRAAPSAITVSSRSHRLGGDAGALSVLASGDLDIADGGQIASVSYGSGRAGSVSVSARNIVITGALGPAFPSTISAQSLNVDLGGSAGDVQVRAEEVLRVGTGARLSVSANLTDAGTLSLQAGKDIVLEAGSSVDSSAAHHGGNISLAAGRTVYLVESTLRATAGTRSNASGATGMGGNITIDPEAIVLDHATIDANAAQGRGGNILLETDSFLSTASALTASGREAGTIDIVAPELDLSKALVQLPRDPLNAANQLRDLCAHRLRQEFSSVVVRGAGGVAVAPGEAAPGSGRPEGR